MKRVFLTINMMLFLTPLLGKGLVLDEVMSSEDQKKSGVSYLNPQQKIALEEWLNKNCNCPNRIAPEEDKKILFVSINIDAGRKIQLNDNSIWDVAPEDHEISEAWLSSIPIKIVPSDDPDYPYLLVNRNTGVSIHVKRGEAPPTIPYRGRQPKEVPSTKEQPASMTGPASAPKKPQ